MIHASLHHISYIGGNYAMDWYVVALLDVLYVLSLVRCWVGGEGLHACSAADVASMARSIASPAGYTRENTGEQGCLFAFDYAENGFIVKKGYSRCTFPRCVLEKVLGRVVF